MTFWQQWNEAYRNAFWFYAGILLREVFLCTTDYRVPYFLSCKVFKVAIIEYATKLRKRSETPNIRTLFLLICILGYEIRIRVMPLFIIIMSVDMESSEWERGR